MAQKKETLFRKKFDVVLKGIAKSCFFSVQQMALIGLPDKVGVVNGWFVALELKKDHLSKATKLQLWWLQKFRNAGGYAAVVHPDNADMVVEHLKDLSEGNSSPNEIQEDWKYEQ